MVFINTSQSIGIVISHFTTYISGSLFLTLFILLILFMAFFELFRVPIEFSAIFLLPFLLTVMAYTQEFVMVGGVIIIYLAILFVRTLFIK